MTDTPTTDALIAELRALDEKATKNWAVRVHPQNADEFIVRADRLSPQHPYDIELLGEDRHEKLYPVQQARADADLIVAMRNALPTLLDLAQPRAGASGEREAAEDMEKTACRLLRQQIGDGDKGVSITWGGNPDVPARMAIAAIVAALTRSEADEAPGVECTAKLDHADIMETINNASDDWQKNGYTSALAEVRDMANVGRALMEALPPGYSYMNCPSEIVSDLQNERDEALAAQPAPGVEIPAGMAAAGDVQQIDRTNAADLLDELSNLLDHNGLGQVADLIRDGEYDDHEAVAAFVRHRVAATPIAQPVAPSREAVAHSDDHYTILIRAAEDAEVAASLHRGAVADGYADSRAGAEWQEKQARTFRIVADRLTPDAAKSDAVAWRVNDDTPSVIITPHGRISVSWSTQRAGEDNDFTVAEETAALIVAAVNAYPLATIAMTDAAVEALQTIANAELVDVMCDPGWPIRIARAALATPTAPSDQA